MIITKDTKNDYLNFNSMFNVFSFFFQLNYSKAQAGMFSTMFEIGGVAGSALVGVIINR